MAYNFETAKYKEQATLMQIKIEDLESTLPSYLKAYFPSAQSMTEANIAALNRLNNIQAGIDQKIGLILQWIKADSENSQTYNDLLSRLYILRGAIKERTYDLSDTNFKSAITDFTMAIELNPKEASAYFQRTKAQRGERNVDAAIADYKTGLSIEPTNAKAHYQLGRLSNRKEEKVVHYEAAIQADHYNVKAYESWLGCQIKENYSTLLQELERHIQAEPKNFTFYFKYVLICFKYVDNFDKALEYIDKAIEFCLNSTEDNTYHLLTCYLSAMNTCWSAGFAQRAIGYYENRIIHDVQISPNVQTLKNVLTKDTLEKLYRLAGTLYLELHLYSSAVAALTKHIQMSQHKDDNEIYYHRAQAYYFSGEHKAAFDDLTKYLPCVEEEYLRWLKLLPKNVREMQYSPETLSQEKVDRLFKKSKELLENAYRLQININKKLLKDKLKDNGDLFLKHNAELLENHDQINEEPLDENFFNNSNVELLEKLYQLNPRRLTLEELTAKKILESHDQINEALDENFFDNSNVALIEELNRVMQINHINEESCKKNTKANVPTMFFKITNHIEKEKNKEDEAQQKSTKSLSNT